jgi:hypothetical protein
MIRLEAWLKRALTGTLIIIQTMFFPVVVLADHPAEPAHKCPAAYGTTNPTGSDSRMFSFNTTACKWESQYYSWDPATKIRSPRFSLEYKLNNETGQMERTNWIYSPAARAYIARIQVLPQPQSPPPAPITSSVSSPNGSSDPNNDTQPIGSSSPVNAVQSGSGTNGIITPMGTMGTNNRSSGNLNSSGLASSSGAVANANTNVKAGNVISSYALSGSAQVQGNTNGGDAITGDTTAYLNLVNLLQSSWNPADGQLITFIEDIDGDVVGDLTIDPGQFAPGKLSTRNFSIEPNLDIRVASEGQIKNAVVLDSTSGDAQIAGNTSAGQARTGSADAVANVVNLMNSAISANSSFLGILNINGNLNGDILLPPDFIDQLIASNTPTATLDTSNIENGQLLADVTANQAINNNVAASAISGTATVAGNTTAGGAATGKSSTNVTLFNLTGNEVVAGNAILVFVNVLGEWVGLIMEAPAGSTAAVLGGAVRQNNSLANNKSVSIRSNNAITNDVWVNARSGDASVRYNTNAGHAATGDATASANIANIIGSQLSLSDWFSVLFINVFGSWNGSFGIDTAAGNPVITAAATHKAAINNADAVRVFRFVPSDSGDLTRLAAVRASKPSPPAHVNTPPTQPESRARTHAPTAIAAASTILQQDGNRHNPRPPKNVAASNARDWTLTIISILAATILLGTERYLSLRGNRQSPHV